MKIYLIILLSLLSLWPISAQDSAEKEQATVQPTIMVIPFAAKGQSIRAAYERNEMVRIAITKLKEAFDTRGVNTIDLRGKLKQVSNNDVLTEDQQKELKDDVIELSGADIYVEVEASKNMGQGGNSANVIMTAYDAFSGESLANKVSTSPKFRTDDFEKLIEKAVEAESENFLNTIQEKFNTIQKVGRTAVLHVGIDSEASFDLDHEVGADGDLLSEVVEDWVEQNAYKNYYHLQGATENRMIFDIVKVPLKDEKGRNYRVTKLAASFRKFVQGLGYDLDRIVNGNTLILTIKDAE